MSDLCAKWNNGPTVALAEVSSVVMVTRPSEVEFYLKNLTTYIFLDTC